MTRCCRTVRLPLKLKVWRNPHVWLLLFALASTGALLLEERSLRGTPAWVERVSGIVQGTSTKADILRDLGPPQSVFEARDFLSGFPLPGYTYEAHRPKGPVWVYTAPHDQQRATYIYFDRRGVVEHVAHVVRTRDMLPRKPGTGERQR